MNVKEFKDIMQLTVFVNTTGDYCVRKFKESPHNYLIADNYGDFLIIEASQIDNVCSVIWNDMHSNKNRQHLLPQLIN